ncbi:hypothetical protein Tco_0941259 [Tanacetum coccineum]|uniref:Uncharacterized protein n=1 Tax=Tanacetum coccineum TaxID=301880 RepID=A0ABQ5DX18_9ASTR
MRPLAMYVPELGRGSSVPIDLFAAFALTSQSLARSRTLRGKLWVVITVKAKTVNEEVQLQALVDKKKVIITESTIRRDLQLEDANGVDCLPNAAIFE